MQPAHPTATRVLHRGHLMPLAGETSSPHAGHFSRNPPQVRAVAVPPFSVLSPGSLLIWFTEQSSPLQPGDYSPMTRATTPPTVKARVQVVSQTSTPSLAPRSLAMTIIEAMHGTKSVRVTKATRV